MISFDSMTALVNSTTSLYARFDAQFLPETSALVIAEEAYELIIALGDWASAVDYLMLAPQSLADAVTEETVDFIVTALGAPLCFGAGGQFLNDYGYKTLTRINGLQIEAIRPRIAHAQAMLIRSLFEDGSTAKKKTVTTNCAIHAILVAHEAALAVGAMDDLESAVRRVIAKNDAKTLESHIYLDGKIRRREGDYLADPR